MKRIFALLVAAGLAAGLAGCTKCSPKSLMKTEEASLAVEDVGKTLAPSICEKYASCNQSPDFNKDQCLQEIATGISENLKTAKDLKVTQATLDGCKMSINASTCEALNSTTPPQGCEFLQ